MREVDTIIFDFNGTLMDDVVFSVDMINIVIRNHKLKEVTVKEYLDLFCFPVKKYYENIGFTADKYDFAIVGKQFIDNYMLNWKTCKLYPNVIKVLEHFKDKRLILLSASQKDNLKQQLDYYDISKYFKVILGIDNIYASSKVNIAKEYFEKEKINKEKTIFIGDTNHDFDVANELGVACILLSKGHQSKEKSKAQINIDDISELINLIK